MPLPLERGAPPTGPGDPAEVDRPDGGGVGSAISDPFVTAFPPGVAAKLGWYVYLLTDPGSGRPFYVGRGRGDRCFRHLQAARLGPDGDPGAADGGRDGGAKGRPAPFPLLELIREIEAREGAVPLEILRYRLSSDEARLVQAAAADALGLRLDLKLGGQRQPAAELGTHLAKRAKFRRDHQVVLLRIGEQGADMRYESVRHDWRIGRRWIDPRSTRSPRWAVIVAGELVVAVYRIDRWEPTPLPGPARRPGASGGAAFTARSTYRHSFIGVRDEELEGRYVGRSVATYLGNGPGPGPGVRGGGAGVPSQVAYVWCGPNWVNSAG
jgi:hypothetical protein